MPKTAGLVLIASFLFVYGLQMLAGGASDVPVHSTVATRVIFVVLGIISLATSVAIWRRHPAALRAYSLWALSWLTAGAAVQYIIGTAPIEHVCIWWVFVGVTLLAVGLYLRSTLSGELQRDAEKPDFD